MQVVPVVLALGAVSWVVCALSVQSETEAPIVRRKRLGSAAQRTTSRLGALRVQFPGLGMLVAHQTSRAARATGSVLTEAGRGIVAAAAAVRDGVRQDATTVYGWTKGAWERLSRLLGPRASMVMRAVRARAPTAGRTVGGLARAALGRGRSATRWATRSAATASVGVRRRRVRFDESLSLTAVLGESHQGFELGPSPDEGHHTVRGALGLVVLIAVIGVAIAAGLMGMAWTLKHFLVRGVG